MALKDVDLGNALRRLADKRIEDAMAEGKFSKLAGMGKPLELEDMPAEEGARMMWWMLRIMKNNDFTPDEVRMRKALDGVWARLADVKDEQGFIVLVKQANDLVYKINTLGTNALKAPVTPIDPADELARFRARGKGA